MGHLEGIAQSWKATMIFAGKDIGGSEQNLISFFIPLERHFVVQLVKCFEPSSKACFESCMLYFVAFDTKKAKRFIFNFDHGR